MVQYFTSMFSSTQMSDSEMRHVLDKVQPRLSPYNSGLLDRPFTAEEVRVATFDIAPNKAPCPDGLPGLFYQNFWDVVGPSVTADCLKCLNDGCSLERFNKTLVVLIPKVRSQERMAEFRPISLCNVIYKIVAKALANHLQHVLDEVISDA